MDETTGYSYNERLKALKYFNTFGFCGRNWEKQTGLKGYQMLTLSDAYNAASLLVQYSEWLNSITTFCAYYDLARAAANIKYMQNMRLNSWNNSENKGRTPVIGRMNDMQNVGSNEYRVADLLPDQGSPQANWQQNSSVLRSIMYEGNPIRDASLFNSSLDPQLGVVGTQNASTFLHMERSLLYEHGWRYINGFWILP